MRPSRQGGPDDAQLLRMLHEVEEREGAMDAAVEPAPEPEPAGDPCPNCGEPAEHLGECNACAEPGCLPPDVWSPGMGEPCLTLCSRCARQIHLACGAEDQAGNLRCPTCAF